MVTVIRRQHAQFAVIWSALLVAPYVSAAQPSWMGIWSGEVASKRVMACLNDNEGSYYYYGHWNSIPLLRKSDDGLSWIDKGEIKATGELRFESISEESMSGTWHSMSKNATAPIHLDRVHGAIKGDDRCNGIAYNEPRVAGQARTISAPIKSGVESYEKVSALGGKLQTIRVLNDGPGWKKINQEISDDFNHSIVEYFDCSLSLAVHDERAADDVPGYEKHTEVVSIAGPFLVINTVTDEYCGGTSSSPVEVSTTWNVPASTKVNPDSWINGKGYEKGSAEAPLVVTTEFRKLLTKQWRSIPRCSDKDLGGDFSVMAYAFNFAYPTTKGAVFRPTLDVESCESDIVVPWNELDPYLTAEGRVAAAAFSTAASAPP